ncbi:S8 family peptidase [Amycolatopsis sp. NPDC051061]|uniref:S8 family peptidase n=1 Tax=Amycolatopsis sp. NPDC051061 TaxID=3155042 RepID=UPI00343DF97F
MNVLHVWVASPTRRILVARRRHGDPDRPVPYERQDERMRKTMRKRSGARIGLVGTIALAIGLIATPAQAAEGRILAAGSATAIPDSYIVKLRHAGDPEAVANRFGAKVGKVYTNSLKGFSATLSERQAKRLAADPEVDSVEQNQVVHATTTQVNPPSWGLDRIGQPGLPLNQRYEYTTTGAGVNVYVIDTGVRISHRTFGGRARNGFDFIDNDTVAQDGNGHGTHVAGTIAGAEYGIAKGATIYAVRVLDNSGSGTIAGVIAGVDWVTKNHTNPAVANLSLGGGISDTLDNAVRQSINSGVTYGIAAGNESADSSSSSPARVSEAITVGSTTTTDVRSGFSNFGPGVDVFAPGSAITSSSNGSDTASATLSGTSMATPHVVGIVARYLQNHRTAKPAEVATAITNASVKNKVTDPGPGSPNRLLFWLPTS